ncbi:armadillo-type protein [Obelidium mucronatum]|nr:armadillo-type protein [Obelidium mucronatum]
MAEEEDFKALPLSDRLVHSNWKCRSGAFDELASKFKSLDPAKVNEYRDWADYLKKGISDSNAVAHEAALGALLSLAEFGPVSFVPKTRSTLVPIVVDKGLAHTRAGTRQRSLDVLLMYVEVENKGDGVLEDVLPGLDHKTPKNVSACVVALREILRNFGSKVVPVKPLLKPLAKLFDHKDGTVRNEATNLAIELYKWLGPAILPSLSDLKPVQLKDLNEQFEKCGSSGIKAAPERIVRSEMEKRQAVGYVAPEETASPTEAAAPEPVDVFDLSDPVNVLDKMSPKFYESLQATKWSDRKETLESLLAIIKVPKLEDGRYGELVNVLAKKINDPHVIVLTLAINCLECLMRGLRSNFSQYRGIVLTPLLEKLKEKKTAVIEAIRNSLDALFLCINSIADILEDLSPFFKHKNPQVKQETTLFLLRCLQNMRKAPAKGDLKILSELMVNLLDDADAGVRESAMEGLGTLMRIVGERAMTGFMEKVDKAKEIKVREYFEKAVVRVGGAGPAKKPATAPAAMAATVPKAVSPVPVKQPTTSTRPGTVKPTAAKKPASASASASTAPSSASGAAGSKKKNVSEEPLTFKFSDDTAEAWMAEAFPGLNLAEFSDSNWKIRLGACHAFAETIKEAPSLEPEAIIRFLSKSPGWKESNFQVMTAMVSLFDFLAKAKASKGALSLVITALAEKLGDAKLKKVTGDCFTCFAEQYSLQFVLSNLYEPLTKAKSPKTLADAFLWIHQSVLEFGIQRLDVKGLVEFVKAAGLSNTNAAVRANAVIVLGGLRMFVGPGSVELFILSCQYCQFNVLFLDIRTFVADLSGQQLALIDAEFDKVAARAPPEPSRVVVDAVGGGGGADDPMDTLFPRVDITSKMSPELLEKLGHAQWQLRKEGLEELAGVIESSKRLKANLGEVPAALKARLGDSNKNLGIMAVEICGNLAIAVGKPFAKHTGVLIGPMSGLLGDQKPHVRAAAINALENVHTACGVDCFISPAAASLVADQPNLRKDLLKFLGEKLDAAKKSPDTTVPKLEELLKPLLMCLQDKNSDVRKFAAAVLVFVAEDVGIGITGSALASLKPFFSPLQEIGGSSNAKSGSLSPKPATKKLPEAKVKPAASVANGLKKKPASAPAAVSSKSVEPASPGNAGLPVLTSDMRAKEVRAGQDRGMTKWTFEAPRKDLVEFLNDQCNGNLSEPVVALLFSTDHYKEKDFLQGLTILDENIQLAMTNGDSEMKARFIANTDLVLKYLTIRFFDTNTTMLMKVLDLLEHLFGLLDEEGVALTDLEQVGDNKETMRLCKIYPPSKLFTYLLSALTSKNSRVRTECLEELGDLLKKNGMSMPKFVMPALGTITQAYIFMGDAVYKQLGRISEKDKSLLEEKVKRLPVSSLIREQPLPTTANSGKKLPVPSGRSESPTASVGIPRPSSANGVVRKEFSLDLDKVNFNARSASPAVVQQNQQEQPLEQPQEQNDALMIEYLITQVTSGDAFQSIDALKQLEKVITGPVENVVCYINEIVSAVTLQIRIAFGAADVSSAGTMRLCKHLVNTLVQIYSNPQIAKSIQRVSLHQCVQELLNRLLDPSLQNMDQGPQLAKALNVLMVRVLDNTDRNLSFGVLLTLLEQSASTSTQCSPEDLPLQAKYTELVMKCLWKLTKVIPQLIQEKQLDAGQLILGVHEFLKTSPPNEWKRRAAEKIIPQADMPLRTVKTILHELCNCLGERALQCTALVDDPSRSHAVGYMRQMLGQPAAAVAAPIPSSASRPTASPTEYDQKLQALKRSMTAPARDSTDQLANISASKHVDNNGQLNSGINFARSNSEGPLQGIADLYQFKKQHPDCEAFVNQHLGKTGNYFQGYIKRGLAALENDEKNGVSGGSSLISPTATSAFGSSDGVQGSSRSTTDVYRETLSRFQQHLHKPDSVASSEPTLLPKQQRFSVPTPAAATSTLDENHARPLATRLSVPPSSGVSDNPDS